MSTILDHPLRTLVNADAAEPGLSQTAEALVARVAAMVYGLVRDASPTAVSHAAASGSNAALVGALAEIVASTGSADDEWTMAMLRGQVALAELLENAGGVWTADVAVTRLGVSRTTLQNWRKQGRVVCIRTEDGSFVYPAAQFEQPRSDRSQPRPYPGVSEVSALLAKQMTPEELVALLATPQDMLATSKADARTMFQAMADGDTEHALVVAHWVATPADDGAPLLKTKPARRTA
ncbi:MAG: hypothetical protein ABI120_08490 [Gemmatimonadaceae bacterium]